MIWIFCVNARRNMSNRNLTYIGVVLLVGYMQLQGGEMSVDNCEELAQNGSCICCSSGYRGATCTDMCELCISRPVNGKCTYFCEPGYYGDVCNATCPGTCALSKTGVSLCKEDNGLPVCSNGCIQGFYDEHCNKSCHENCLDNSCYHIGGKCLKCNNSHYGDHCNFSCSKGCISDTCNRTGYCTNGCREDFYGDRCTSRCGSNCINGNCTSDVNSTYYCTEGCKTWYTGHNCSEKCPDHCERCDQLSVRCTACEEHYIQTAEREECVKENQSANADIMPGVTGGVIAVIAVIVFIIIIIIYKIKRKRRAEGNISNHDDIASAETLLPIHQQRDPIETNVSDENTKGACNRCDAVRRRCKQKGIFGTFVILHERASMESQEKRQFARKVETAFAALVNTEGGCIILHVDGQLCNDRNIKYFHQILSKRIRGQVDEEESMFHECWLSSAEGFDDIEDFVLITVEKANKIVTVEFNTKIRKGRANKRPSRSEVLSYMRKPPKPNDQLLQPLEKLEWGLQISSDLRMSPNVEFKTIGPGNIEHSASSLVDYIWSELDLKDNISSMSKLENGGSYYVGIKEERIEQTEETIVDGFELQTDVESFVQTLLEKIHLEVRVLNEDSFKEPSDRLAQIKLHTNEEADPKKHVLEVVISHVDGVVFYDKGPKTYSMENDISTRMENITWLEGMKNIIDETS